MYQNNAFLWKKKSWTYGEEYRHTKVEYRSRQSHVQSCRSLLMLGSCQWRHNAWPVVTSQSLFRFGNCLILLWSKYVRFQIVPTFNQVLVFFFCKEFLRFFLFYSFKIAKRVKKKPRLSNFRHSLSAGNGNRQDVRYRLNSKQSRVSHFILYHSNDKVLISLLS